MESQEFVVEEILRQGGVLRPLLLNLFVDDVIAETKNDPSELYVELRHLQPVYIQQYAFADDLPIYAKSEHLQKNIEIRSRALAKKANNQRGEIKCNDIWKTKQVSVINIIIEGKNHKQVINFKYLGVNLNRDSGQEIEIRARIESTARMHHSIKGTFIGKKDTQKG